MNPICKQNINSAECQQWMNEVFIHCNHLLANKRLEFWNDWWLNEQREPHHPMPHLMTSYDCLKLKKEMEKAEMKTPVMQRFSVDDMDTGWKMLLVLIVVCLAVVVIGSMVWLLNSTLRRIALPRFTDCERQGYGRKNCSSASPRSFISFGRPCHPQTRFGPYRSKKIVVPRGACSSSKR